MADDATGSANELTDEELKGKGMGTILLVVLSLVLIAGGLGAGLMLGKKDQAPMPTVTKAPTTLIVVELDDVYVNIAETKATRVLKLSPVLELSEERLVSVVEGRIPLIRDLISETACRMSIQELDGSNGRQILKREIKNQLNVMLRDHMAGAVKNIYFSDFLIQ